MIERREMIGKNATNIFFSVVCLSPVFYEEVNKDI